MGKSHARYGNVFGIYQDLVLKRYNNTFLLFLWFYLYSCTCKTSKFVQVVISPKILNFSIYKPNV